MTVTEAILIPTIPDRLILKRIVFVVEDIYSTDQRHTANYPVTLYGTPGSIATGFLGRPTEYPSHIEDGVEYGVWGTFDGTGGLIDPNDFYGSFAGLWLEGGPENWDYLVIKAGTVELPAGIPLPDRPVSTLRVGFLKTTNDFILSEPIPVPETSTLLLGAAGVALLLQRRRLS